MVLHFTGHIVNNSWWFTPRDMPVAYPYNCCLPQKQKWPAPADQYKSLNKPTSGNPAITFIQPALPVSRQLFPVLFCSAQYQPGNLLFCRC